MQTPLSLTLSNTEKHTYVTISSFVHDPFGTNNISIGQVCKKKVKFGSRLCGWCYNQTRHSPPTVIERVKMENEFVGKRGFSKPRQSTVQRYTFVGFNRLYADETLKGDAENENGDASSTSTGKKHGKSEMHGVGVEEGRGLEKLNKEHVRRDGRRSRSTKWKKQADDQMSNGWPKWLADNVPSEVLAAMVPRSAESYDKIDKVGQGTYSNVFKARDRDTGKIVALKKVKFDTSKPESIQFMAREIMILQKLDHPNIIKLEGLATSRLHYSLYLVFDYMQTDLARIIARSEERLTEPQVKCYMMQLLSALEHCHERGILHRDIKGSNILIDKDGMLKIADFGLANFYASRNRPSLTNRVVTLWYRAPELLLGATDYGVGIDLWSAGCLMAEMFTGYPIMTGRSEVEQLYKIFKLCGTPTEEYYRKLKLSTNLRPPKSYKPTLLETFKYLPTSSARLISTLLALDPAYRGRASSALNNEFFSTRPLACSFSGLPVIYKEKEEQVEASEQMTYMNATIKRRSQKYRDRSKKELPSPAEEKLSNKEVINKKEETYVSSEATGSAISSTSSGPNSAQLENNTFSIFSPIISSHQKLTHKPSDHSNSGHMLDRSPPANPKTQRAYKKADFVYRLKQVNRSVPSRQHLVPLTLD